MKQTTYYLFVLGASPKLTLFDPTSQRNSLGCCVDEPEEEEFNPHKFLMDETVD